jgi:hypothetical protein
MIANLDIYGDQNIRDHTTGTWSGTPLLDNAAFANGTAVVAFDAMVGTVVDAVVAGDTITIAGVNSVNPVSYEDTGNLMQFVVTIGTNTAAGAGSITVYPPLDDGSTANEAASQNVSALPADNAAIVIAGVAATPYAQNLMFHKNALALVTVPLELPDSAVFKARADWRGYSIRVIKDYDIVEDEEIIRLDIMYGTKAIYPEIGIRVDGA